MYGTLRKISLEHEEEIEHKIKRSFGMDAIAYGLWQSPITAELASASSVSFQDVVRVEMNESQ